MSRKNAREEVFKLIFEGQIKNENAKDILCDYLKREEKTEKEDEIEFIKKYLSEIDENQSHIIEKIEENMVG